MQGPSNGVTIVAHARARLATDQRTVVIHADAREPDGVLTQATNRHLDLTRPVGVLIIGLLEHLDRHTAVAFLSECWRVLSPGSVLRLAVPDFDRQLDFYTTMWGLTPVERDTVR